MLTLEQYNELRARIDTYESWRNGRQSITVAEESAAPVHVTNEERSAVEVYEFAHSAPERYFAYVAPAKDNPIGTMAPRGYVTTWTGDVLGEIYWRGQPYRSNIGDRRQNIRVQAINGLIYFGTYYESSGDYCRLRVTKLSKQLHIKQAFSSADIRDHLANFGIK